MSTGEPGSTGAESSAPAAPDAEALAYLAQLERFGTKPGLRRIRALLRTLGNPQASLRTVHVAGTNGKGSTAAVLATILTRAGHRTGLYTKPHVRQYGERFMIDGRPMPPDALAAGIRALRAAIAAGDFAGDPPTQFEVETALLYGYMAEQGVDLLVQEVGLGGRLDTTNVVRRPLLTIITRIGYDHMEHLGRRLAAIAREKAGIIKPGVPVLTGVQRGPAWEVISATARLRGAPLCRLVPGGPLSPDAAAGLPDAGTATAGLAAEGVGEAGTFAYTVDRWDADGGRFLLRLPEGELLRCRTPLLGRHQVFNAALAASAACLLDAAGVTVPRQAVRDGMARTRWPGRTEVLAKAPWLLLDGAHNPGGARVLRQTLDRLQPRGGWLFLFGPLVTKDAAGMLRLLLRADDAIILTRPPVAAGADPAALAGPAAALGATTRVVEGAGEALTEALAGWREGRPLCICGSLALLRELRPEVKEVLAIP